jgi:hypothetical protein
MLHIVPNVMSAVDTMMRVNIAASGFAIPEFHSEFLRGRGLDYRTQLDLYVSDSFVFPAIREGFTIERLVPIRDYNHALVFRKPD